MVGSAELMFLAGKDMDDLIRTMARLVITIGLVSKPCYPTPAYVRVMNDLDFRAEV
jgi:hypothetical protein